MIYDAAGNLWATPRRIGFRAEVQTTSHEPAEHVTFQSPEGKVPAWLDDGASKPSAEPYSARMQPRRISAPPTVTP
jgi:hypothetical protein